MPDSEGTRGFTTRAVHAGERAPRPDFTPTTTPIYLSSSFSYDSTDDLDAIFGNDREGYVYTRYGNPTTRAFEEAVANLEGTDESVAFASGMAAVHAAILNEVQAGNRVVAARDVYGATYAVLTNLFATLGVKTTFVDILDLETVARTVEELKPRVVLFETISNPLMRVADIAAIVDIAHARKARVICDNTFATPLLVNPVRFAVDSIVHSSTKYLGGHGDVTGGVVATDWARAAELRELNKLTGAILGPFESWLTLRGLKTLSLRVPRQSENAATIAAWLTEHPRISTVHYPGLSEPGPADAQFNSDLRGGMVSFEIADAGKEQVFRFMEALRICVPATTLGDVFSLVLSPPSSSHRALTPEQRAEIGISDGLVRLSVGIEDVEDIIMDLEQALDATCVGAKHE
ncbi:MAG: trans-sulfuration enzyme family protein [Thermomicrobiales bacterium]